MDFKKRPKKHTNKSVENIGGCFQVDRDDVSFASTGRSGDYCIISSILIIIELVSSYHKFSSPSTPATNQDSHG